jgi:zona occludens toxin (predicted ATPase)
MITMVHGYPGGGKSYYCVEYFILPALKSGMHVYSSLAGFDALRAGIIHGIDASLYHPIEPDCFLPWDGIDHRALYVLDEVQNLYGSSNFKEHPKEREQLKQYLSTHRHRGDSVVAICQEPNTVDKFFRDLTEHFIHVRKKNFLFGQNTKQFLANHRKGGFTRKEGIIKRENLRYKPEVFICYQSTLIGTTESKTSADNVRVNPLSFLWPFFIVFILLGIAAYFHFKNNKPSTQSSISSVVNQNGVQNVPKVKIAVDGWLADSLCVRWLAGSVEVAKSCPDLSERSGSLPCRLASGDSCFVVVRAREVFTPGDRKQVPKMEPSDSWSTGGSPSAPRPTVSPGVGIRSGG